MGFPLNSTSVMTRAIARVGRVLNRAPIAQRIGSGGVYVCKTISGSSSYSQHSWGNAVDLFPKSAGKTPREVQNELDAMFHAIIRHSTRRTAANLGRKLAVAEIIHHDGRLIWTPDRGIHAYGGTTGPHIHVSGAPLKGGRPPCAGGI